VDQRDRGLMTGRMFNVHRSMFTGYFERAFGHGLHGFTRMGWGEAETRFCLAAKGTRRHEDGRGFQAWIATGAVGTLAMTIETISSAVAAASTQPGMTQPSWLLDSRRWLGLRCFASWCEHV
jgi:hypothetical protein